VKPKCRARTEAPPRWGKVREPIRYTPKQVENLMKGLSPDDNTHDSSSGVETAEKSASLSNQRHFKNYLRVCQYCDKCFKATSKWSRTCDVCAAESVRRTIIKNRERGAILRMMNGRNEA
jgi:hypothetical protein